MNLPSAPDISEVILTRNGKKKKNFSGLWLKTKKSHTTIQEQIVFNFSFAFLCKSFSLASVSIVTK